MKVKVVTDNCGGQGGTPGPCPIGAGRKPKDTIQGVGAKLAAKGYKLEMAPFDMKSMTARYHVTSASGTRTMMSAGEVRKLANNVYCSTGEGGGVRPHCSAEGTVGDANITPGDRGNALRSGLSRSPLGVKVEFSESDSQEIRTSAVEERNIVKLAQS
jgi:hypothetical protein